MTRSEQGFNLKVENTTHLMRIRLWGRWNAETGEQYLREFQQKLSGLSGNDRESWSILLDLTGYVLASQEVQAYIKQGFFLLRKVLVGRQAILLHGPIIHLPGQAALQSGASVVSYFQSEDEALNWLNS